MMRAYTISCLARDAGVTVHIIRDYELRGLLHPLERNQSGFRIYDRDATLARLRFIIGAKAAGIQLKELVKLFQALESGDQQKLMLNIEACKQSIRQRQERISHCQSGLAKLEEAGLSLFENMKNRDMEENHEGIS